MYGFVFVIECAYVGFWVHMVTFMVVFVFFPLRAWLSVWLCVRGFVLCACVSVRGGYLYILLTDTQKL